MYTGPHDEDPDERDAALLRQAREEREREERRVRRDRASRVIVAWVMAAALALLSYDSGGAAIDARQDGRPWRYPACVSVICLLGLVWLAVRAVRRRRRDRISHGGPG
jgi:hypothetical protein